MHYSLLHTLNTLCDDLCSYHWSVCVQVCVCMGACGGGVCACMRVCTSEAQSVSSFSFELCGNSSPNASSYTQRSGSRVVFILSRWLRKSARKKTDVSHPNGKVVDHLEGLGQFTEEELIGIRESQILLSKNSETLLQAYLSNAPHASQRDSKSLPEKLWSSSDSTFWEAHPAAWVLSSDNYGNVTVEHSCGGTIRNLQHHWEKAWSPFTHISHCRKTDILRVNSSNKMKTLTVLWTEILGSLGSPGWIPWGEEARTLLGDNT